ncbi:MAG: hypothetical protein WBF07_21985, partial [Xanthobacteraceae bacterium]
IRSGVCPDIATNALGSSVRERSDVVFFDPRPANFPCDPAARDLGGDGGTFDASARAQLGSALSDETRLVSIVRSANEASKHFDDLKYWLTDFAQGLALSSQQNAAAAKAELDEDLKGIAPIDGAGVAAIQHDVNTLWELVERAGDAYYSRDDSAGGSALLAEAQSHVLNVNKEIDGIVDRIERRALSQRDASILNARRAVDVSIVGGFIALAIALSVTALIVRSINAPLRRLERSMNGITQGRLDLPITTGGRDDG